MTLRRSVTGVLLTTFVGLTFACGSSGTSSANNNADAGTGGGNSQNNHPDSGTPSGDAGQGLSFVPSNAPNAQLNLTAKAATITGACTIDTTAGTIDCLDKLTDYTSQAITQNNVDATAAMVFSLSSLAVTASANVTVVGNRPLIIVTEGPISIAGTLQATPASFAQGTSLGGGFSAPSGGSIKGLGPGAGGAPLLTTHVGAGGGAYCGKGGNSTGGVPYGKPEITPLLGGSSGGDGFTGGGAGGGGIQLISGESISIATTGVIHVGGGGAFFGGNGGGSGGAILLEAPTVAVRGTLAANGGAGSANSGSGAESANASPDAVAAPGGTTTSTTSTGAFVNLGGDGSAAAVIDGTAGQYTLNPGGGLSDFGGGGGGGAGRIRINTTSGQATLSGTLSPSASTTCVSQGKLVAK